MRTGSGAGPVAPPVIAPFRFSSLLARPENGSPPSLSTAFLSLIRYYQFLVPVSSFLAATNLALRQADSRLVSACFTQDFSYSLIRNGLASHRSTCGYYRVSKRSNLVEPDLRYFALPPDVSPLLRPSDSATAAPHQRAGRPLCDRQRPAAVQAPDVLQHDQHLDAENQRQRLRQPLEFARRQPLLERRERVLQQVDAMAAREGRLAAQRACLPRAPIGRATVSALP